MDTLMLAARVILSLACVIGLIWFAGRRMQGPRRARAQREAEVRLVGKQAVSRHSGVAVIAVGNRRMLVGYGDQQVSMLTELAPVMEPAPLPTPARGSATTGPGGVALAKVRSLAPRLPSPRTPADESAKPSEVSTSPVTSPSKSPSKSPSTGPTKVPAKVPTTVSSEVPSEGALQGSVLSPDTWRTLVRTLQDRTVRR